LCDIVVMNIPLIKLQSPITSLFKRLVKERNGRGKGERRWNDRGEEGMLDYTKKKERKEKGRNKVHKVLE